MKTKGKIFAMLAVAAALAVGIGLYQLYANLDAIVARIIEERGSEATGTAVSVAGVALELRAGRGRIRELAVANPADFSDRPAIAFDEIGIEMDPLAVTADPIVIREVSVRGARLLLEQTTAGNNLRRLQAALEQASPAEDDAAAGPGIVIERFVLEDADLEIDLPQLGESRRAGVRRIELNDIGRASGGATATAVARQILLPVLKTALESAAAEGLRDEFQEGLDGAEERVKEKLLDSLPLPGRGEDRQNDEQNR